MSIIIFDNNDRKYLKWINANSFAFIVNTKRGKNSSYNVLHRAKCSHISSIASLDKGAFTERDYIKICSNDINELKKWFENNNTQFTGAFYECKSCTPLHSELNESSPPKINSRTQNAFLFAWNPKKWEWSDLEANIEELRQRGKVTIKWRCKSHKKIRVGDRAFLVKLGSELPKGIMASGNIVSEPWSSQIFEDKRKNGFGILIEFDEIFNPNNKEPILTIDKLNTKELSKQNWNPQASGIPINSECIDELEEIWFEFLSKRGVENNPFLSKEEANINFQEGSAIQITLTRYERNSFARIVCLKHYGYSCSVCNFNFESKFGKLGSQYIHVHHLQQIASIDKTYSVNPIADLRPVCPNCHAMLHKQNPPITIEELKEILVNHQI